MKNLEFRIWDAFTKTMTYRFIEPTDLQNSRLTIMQCTGFKDCEGNKIYEGDTIASTNYINNERQVYWCDNEGAWFVDVTNEQNKSMGVSLSYHLKSDNYKIIGNIFEK